MEFKPHCFQVPCVITEVTVEPSWFSNNVSKIIIIAES